jgi:hypothetical protein
MVGDMEGVDALFAAQHGVVSLEQALAAGMSGRRIRHLVATGRWQLRSRGVYAVASAPRTWEQDLMAAVVGRPAAVVSGRSAAALHRFPGFIPRGVPQITIPCDSSTGPAVAGVTRSIYFSALSVVEVGGIPATSPAETVFGVMNVAGVDRLERIVDAVLVADSTAVTELLDILDRVEKDRLRGIRKLRPILQERLTDDHVPNESELEHRLDLVLNHPAVPVAVRQHPLPWAPHTRHRVDRFIPAWGMIVEADGRAWHARAEDFERDRERDNLAAASGIAILRFTARMLEDPVRCRRWVLDAARSRQETPDPLVE